jgi:hypothetical protein
LRRAAPATGGSPEAGDGSLAARGTERPALWRTARDRLPGKRAAIRETAEEGKEITASLSFQGGRGPVLGFRFAALRTTRGEANGPEG